MSPLPASDVTGRRLGHAVLAYLAVVVTVVTLTPFRFVLPPANTLTSTWNGFDLVMNVVMFVPLGFIHRLSKPRATGPVWVGAILWGAALSALIEFAQFFAPGRFPSPFDLVTNTAGAGVGAWLGTAVLRRADSEAAVRALAVELPLMGLVYLLAPLPWLIGLDSRIGERAWLLVPLAASAGWIIGSVFTSFDRAGLPRVLLATAAWLFVALVPSALGALDVVTIAAGAGLGTAWIRSLAPTRPLQLEVHVHAHPLRHAAWVTRWLSQVRLRRLGLEPRLPDGGPEHAGHAERVHRRAREHGREQRLRARGPGDLPEPNPLYLRARHMGAHRGGRGQPTRASPQGRLPHVRRLRGRPVVQHGRAAHAGAPRRPVGRDRRDASDLQHPAPARARDAELPGDLRGPQASSNVEEER